MTKAMARLALLCVVSTYLVACATTKHREPGRPLADRKASAIVGPECSAGGPTVDAVITENKGGKPPHWTFVADMRVRNPGTAPVWLLYDVGDGDTFPSMISWLILRRTSVGREGQVWSFLGDGGFETVRIPGEADLLLRDAELSTLEQKRPPVLAFARRISIDGKPAEEWLGRPELLPATGDLDLNPESRRSDWDREWDADDPSAPTLQVDVLCLTHVVRNAS